MFDFQVIDKNILIHFLGDEIDTRSRIAVVHLASSVAGVLGQDGLLVLVLLDRDGRVVVEALGHELLGEWAALPGRLLQLGPLVLEPDLDLGLVELQLRRQVLAPLLGQVPIRLELGLEPRQLLRRERRPRALVLLVPLLVPFDPA
jgi:hypothetical protein